MPRWSILKYEDSKPSHKSSQMARPEILACHAAWGGSMPQRACDRRTTNRQAKKSVANGRFLLVGHFFCPSPFPAPASTPPRVFMRWLLLPRGWNQKWARRSRHQSRCGHFAPSDHQILSCQSLWAWTLILAKPNKSSIILDKPNSWKKTMRIKSFKGRVRVQAGAWLMFRPIQFASGLFRVISAVFRPNSGMFRFNSGLFRAIPGYPGLHRAAPA